MKLEITNILYRDDLQHQEEHAEKNKEKINQLRAGNSGIMLPDKNLAGACPRHAFLRLNGIDLDVEDDRHIMFEFGRENETIIKNKLIRQLGATFKITGEDTNHVEWTLPSGRVVSGSPDIVIRDTQDTPLLLLEMKLISSMYTAIDVVYNNKPKLGHLIQTMHYAHHLGVPAKLVYVQASDYHVNGAKFILDKLPSPEGGRLPSLEYGEYTDKSGKKTTKVKKLLPVRVVYDVRIDSEEFLQFRKETDNGFWSDTPITMQSMIDFYNFVDEMEKGKDLGPRPLSLSCDGNFEHYNLCEYCGLSKICDRLERNKDKWLEEVRRANNSGELKK